MSHLKPFLDQNFLLQSGAAVTLYHEHAAKMPIIDYHCHINPREIAEDKRYDSITDLWLGGDHYKWRMMRSAGVPESDLTGARERDPFLLFQNYAKALGRAIGNPLYHWSHLELQRYFGIYDLLTEKNAREIYDRMNERLKGEDMSVRGIIRRSNVKLICTTDDPTDDLAWHKKLAADDSFEVPVLPAMRPDKALNADKPGFAQYIADLSKAANLTIASFEDLKAALLARIDYFHALGCRVSDHALEYPIFEAADEATVDAILKKALAGETVSEKEAFQYKTALLLFLAGCYTERDWVMQIHFGCYRNNSAKGFGLLGADSGYDSAGNSRGAGELICLLDAMEKALSLPKMVLYSLNQYDNEVIMTIAGSFQTDSGAKGRIQLGSAWWFNDHKTGMEKQLTDFANLGVLGNFVGMLTDSRSFISYPRHEYFRRILCNLVGGWIENGELPPDFGHMGGLIEDVCYNNAVEFFGFKL